MDWNLLDSRKAGYLGHGEGGPELADLHLWLAYRRLETVAVARAMDVAKVDSAAIETFEPVELQHVY